MQKPFTMSDEMLKEIEINVTGLGQVAEQTREAPGVVEVPHDAPREVFGAPRIRRRPIDQHNSSSPPPGPSNDQSVSDSVNNPKHYTSHPSGVECITVVEWMSFNLGNAVKYLWRSGFKGYQLEDLQKARWYIDREIKRLGGE